MEEGRKERRKREGQKETHINIPQEQIEVG